MGYTAALGKLEDGGSSNPSQNTSLRREDFVIFDNKYIAGRRLGDVTVAVQPHGIVISCFKCSSLINWELRRSKHLNLGSRVSGANPLIELIMIRIPVERFSSSAKKI